MKNSKILQIWPGCWREEQECEQMMQCEAFGMRNLISFVLQCDMDFFSSAPGCWLDLTWTIDMKLSIHATSWPAPAACCLAWAWGAKYADLWFACGGVEVGLGLGPSIMQMKEIIANLPTAIKSPPCLLIFFAQSPDQTLKCYLYCCILSKF